MIAARLAGIRVFATGGIGGVHRGGERTLDISADLDELARTPVLVVCAGPKSVLDIDLTLEYLETRGVPVVGWGTRQLAGFYSVDSGRTLASSVADADEAARLAASHWGLGLATGLVVAVPVPAEAALPGDVADAAIAQAIADSEAAAIHGPAATPFVLARVAELTNGRSVTANLALIENNARVAAKSRPPSQAWREVPSNWSISARLDHAVHVARRRSVGQSRLLRRRAGLRQTDLLGSRYVTQEVEAGRSGELKVDVLRDHFARLGGSVRVTPWWNGAALDRLLDEAHAQVVDATARILPRFAFRVKTELSFSDYGERGSIDIFAGNDDCRAVFVGEAKSEWGSLEETLRRHDIKTRLAPKIAASVFGWKPIAIASVLIFPDDRTARRVADRYSATLTGYSARGREIRAWLRNPDRPLGGIWFPLRCCPGQIAGHAKLTAKGQFS